MSQLLQYRRGTTAQHSTFTGSIGEATYDTDKKVIVAHDGATAGGIPMARESLVALADGSRTITGVQTFSVAPIAPVTSMTGTSKVIGIPLSLFNMHLQFGGL